MVFPCIWCVPFAFVFASLAVVRRRIPGTCNSGARAISIGWSTLAKPFIRSGQQSTARSLPHLLSYRFRIMSSSSPCERTCVITPINGNLHGCPQSDPIHDATYLQNIFFVYTMLEVIWKKKVFKSAWQNLLCLGYFLSFCVSWASLNSEEATWKWRLTRRNENYKRKIKGIILYL